MYYHMIQIYGYAQSINFIGAAEYDKLLQILVVTGSYCRVGLSFILSLQLKIYVGYPTVLGVDVDVEGFALFPDYGVVNVGVMSRKA